MFISASPKTQKIPKIVNSNSKFRTECRLLEFENIPILHISNPYEGDKYAESMVIKS